jgi:hypothetical protein
MAHGYSSLASARLALGHVGNLIEDQGTPEKFGPLVYAFTGDGNVAQVREIVLLRNELSDLIIRRGR